MNVLLIYPQFPDTFWSFKYALPFIHKKAVSPPLGLLTVAAMLPAEWPKRLVDTNVTRLAEKDLAWADLALIGGMTVQRESARQIIARCKQAGVRVVAGGPLFTIEHTQFPDVDHFVLNEAELTLPPFLADLEKGQAQRYYTSSEYADLHTTPIPLWELVDMRQYATMDLQFSRGCPFNCDFCNVTALFGHRPRTKTIPQVIAELDTLYRLGWRGGIFFVDDNLIGNRRVIKTGLLPALKDWIRDKDGITFSTEVSINLADDEELVHTMVAAGFRSVFIGIETPNEDSLASCNKKQNLHRDLVADVRRLHRAGLQVQGGFIVGFDTDPPSIFQRQIDFIQKSGIVTAMVGLLQAPPGTKLFERLKQEGRLIERISGDNVDGTTNIIPKIPIDTLREGYANLLRSIYSVELYYQRVRTFLQDYRLPRVELPGDPKEIARYALALIRSNIRLGILGKERFHYWRLLLWTTFRRPKLFPLAVTLAIYGYHFRRVCELHLA